MNIDDFSTIATVVSGSCRGASVMTVPGPDEDLLFVTIQIPGYATALVLNALLKAGYLAPEGQAGFVNAGNTYLPQLRRYHVGGVNNEFWTFMDENLPY